jgi:nitrite reductase/ring-hydroxylating ferredoxin subunit/multimeric flavodoxin WrbA
MTGDPNLPAEDWRDVGAADELSKRAVQQVLLGTTRVALTYKDGEFGAISGNCNHVGGPLGEGSLEGDFVVCPWHQYRFHRTQGMGEPGFEDDAVPAYHVRVRDGRVEIQARPYTKRSKKPHDPHPLERDSVREDGPVRVVGISTTVMNQDYPRYSTSDALLEEAIGHAAATAHETRLVKLRDLSFRSCEGYYSKSAHACTWPCSITQMDPNDQLDRVYEAFVHWGDVFVIATPIRWGNASSLYYKMVERMNCIQNQMTIANKTLLRDKVVCAIITGGQDNVQGVLGHMMGFFAELGCHFPQYPFIAHSRGWSAEDMEQNVITVQNSEELRAGARGLVDRGVELAERLLATQPRKAERGGRKGKALRA